MPAKPDGKSGFRRSNVRYQSTTPGSLDGKGDCSGTDHPMKVFVERRQDNSRPLNASSDTTIYFHDPLNP